MTVKDIWCREKIYIYGSIDIENDLGLPIWCDSDSQHFRLLSYISLMYSDQVINSQL